MYGYQSLVSYSYSHSINATGPRFCNQVRNGSYKRHYTVSQVKGSISSTGFDPSKERYLEHQGVEYGMFASLMQVFQPSEILCSRILDWNDVFIIQLQGYKVKKDSTIASGLGLNGGWMERGG